jgi:hypothetical protein
MDIRWAEVKVGVLLVASLVFLALGIFLIGQKTRLFAPTTEIAVLLPNVQGLKAGAPVWLSGVVIGTVSDIAFAEPLRSDQVTVTLAIDEAAARRLVPDELAGRSFGRFHAGRLQVLGRHAAGDVEGQHHRPFQARQADGRLRAGSREDQDGNAAQQDHDRDVAGGPRSASPGIAQLSQRAEARRQILPALDHPEIDEDQQRNQY